MAYVALTLFVLAAFGGIALLTFVLAGKETPKAVTIIHGAVAFFGIVTLIISAIYSAKLWLAVIIFILAASGGFYLLARDLSGQKIPKFIAAGHGILALCGIAVLIYLIFYYV